MLIHENTQKEKEGAEVYRLRLPKSLYRNASDIALVYDQSLNSLITKWVTSIVERELSNDALREAIERMRDLRQVRED